MLSSVFLFFLYNSNVFSPFGLQIKVVGKALEEKLSLETHCGQTKAIKHILLWKALTSFSTLHLGDTSQDCYRPRKPCRVQWSPFRGNLLCLKPTQQVPDLGISK